MRAQLWIVLTSLILGSAFAEAKVHSFLTSEELFICNAGVGHSAHPGVVVPGTDSVVVGYENFAMPEESEARFPTTTLTVIPGSQSKKFVTTELEAWDQNIVKTSFDLTTEQYGATYFVDVCYRGPVKKMQGGQDQTQGIYNLTINAQISGSSNHESYQQKARLSAAVDMTCDLRNRGQLTAPRTSEDSKPSGVEVDNFGQTGFISFQQQQLQVVMNLNNQQQQVPRFCRMRFILKENATSDLRILKQSPKDIDLFIDISK